MGIMQNQPRASVVLIAYNAERTIERAIQSACGQSEKSIEIICVDDGSMDSTRAIMQTYAARDWRIRVLTQPNSGTLAARTVGIRQAAGQYILFLDSDDMLRPEAVRTACDAADQLSADVLEFGIELVEDSDNPPTAETMRWMKAYFLQEYPLQEEVQGPALVNACFADRAFPWNLWIKVYRTELLQKAVQHYHNEWLCVAEDMLITLMALCLSKHYVRIQTKLYQYFVGGGMTTANGKNTDVSSMKMWGTEWLALTLAREWLEKIDYPQDLITSGMDGFAREIKEATISYLIDRCAPECRVGYLGWLAQCCAHEEFIDVVCESFSRQDYYKESYDIISSSACWRTTAQIRFVLDKLKEMLRRLKEKNKET